MTFPVPNLTVRPDFQREYVQLRGSSLEHCPLVSRECLMTSLKYMKSDIGATQYLLTIVVTEQLLLYTLLTSMALAIKEGLITKAKLIGLDIALFAFSALVRVQLQTIVLILINGTDRTDHAPSRTSNIACVDVQHSP